MAIKLREVNPVVFNYKVGIGESSPNESLVVVGTSRLEGSPASSGGLNFVSPTLSLKSLGSSENWAGFSWRDKDDNFLWSLTNDLDARNKTNELSLRSAHGTTHDGEGTRAFTILADGKTGWGIRAPQSQFHIGGTATSELRLSNSTIGDAVANGTIIKSGGDAHFYINNLENVGSLYLQSQTVTGFEMDKDLNSSLGGAGTSGGRVTIIKTNIADDATQRMLLLDGKFNVAALGDGEEGLSIAAKLTNSSDTSVTKDLIKFRHNDSNIDTLLNHEGGSVKIGNGVTPEENGLLEVGSNTSAKDVKVRIYANTGDSYLSFGDSAVNFFAGIDTTYGSFNIGFGSGAPSSGSIVVWGAAGDQQGNVGIGTGSTAPDFPLEVAGDVGIDEHIYHNGDHDTYMSFHGGDKWKVRTGGTDRLIIEGGKVGINTGTDTLVQTMTVKGDFSVHGNTLDPVAASPHGIKLTYSDTNTSGVIDTKGNHDLEFRANGVEWMKLTKVGKLEFGTGSGNAPANRKAAIRHFRDDAEGARTINICQAVNYTKETILYSKELTDFREDDVLVINANWGVASTSNISYIPEIYFALILADEPTSGFQTTENSNYIKILEPKITRLYSEAGGTQSYGSNVGGTGTNTSSALYQNNSAWNADKAFDGNSNIGGTYVGMQGLPWNVTKDFGSGGEKNIGKIRFRPNKSTDGYGGVKNWKLQGSTNGSTWVDVYVPDSDNPDNEEWAEHTFTNASSYRYYRMYGTDSHMSVYTSMYEIEMFEIGSVTSGTIFPQEQQMSAMYKVTASDINASRNCINFVLWAKHTSANASCTDELTLTDSGQLDVLQVHGALSD